MMSASTYSNLTTKRSETTIVQRRGLIFIFRNFRDTFLAIAVCFFLSLDFHCLCLCPCALLSLVLLFRFGFFIPTGFKYPPFSLPDLSAFCDFLFVTFFGCTFSL